MKITKLLRTLMPASLIVFTGCASVVSKSTWPVTFKSNPPGAEVVITDKTGNEVNRGMTPTTIQLKSSSGFFSAATYKAEFKLKDYQTRNRGLHGEVNGWYFGNALFGGIGIIGAVFVDPVTGAMWKLQPLCTMDLEKAEIPSGKPSSDN